MLAMKTLFLYPLLLLLVLILEPPCPVATKIMTHMACSVLKAASVVAQEEEESRPTSVKIPFPDLSLLLGLNPIGIVILTPMAH
jgi:hypothetical protein